MAATQARKSDAGNPAAAMYPAVPCMSPNLKVAAMMKRPAKISRPTIMAIDCHSGVCVLVLIVHFRMPSVNPRVVPCADHVLDELLGVRIRGLLLGHLAAAVHHHQPIRDGEDVGQDVGDQDHRDALVAQSAN